ncbi:MAG: hypothetical protein COB14_09465 [Alphaproteobacteria bacterium]|nr:MAG: hypothetical protein COB14_09465 [Alphaproteobacteria bacterium]
MGEEIWISTDVLDFHFDSAGGSFVDESKWKRQYEIWSHTENILENNPSEHDLACAIFQLKRTIDFREKHLHDLYSFHRIPTCAGKQKYEIIEEMGIVKPILKRKLREIRNLVAHNAAFEVQGIVRIQELHEFVWYFLRATDSLSAVIANNFTLYEDNIFWDDNGEWLEISLNFEGWNIDSIRGDISGERMLNKDVKNSFGVSLDRPLMKKSNGYHHFVGSIISVPEKPIYNLAKRYFSMQR